MPRKKTKAKKGKKIKIGTKIKNKRNRKQNRRTIRGENNRQSVSKKNRTKKKMKVRRRTQKGGVNSVLIKIPDLIIDSLIEQGVDEREKIGLVKEKIGYVMKALLQHRPKDESLIKISNELSGGVLKKNKIIKSIKIKTLKKLAERKEKKKKKQSL